MKRIPLLIIPALLLAILIGWRVAQYRMEAAGQANQRAARSQVAPAVSTASPQIRDVVRRFDATGTVEAPLDVGIASKITGRIQFLELREGDRVRKGQVLVRIDPSEVEANVQQASANLAEAEYRLAQAQLIQGPANVSVNTQIKQQEAAVASATADYNQVKANYTAQLAAASANLSDAQSKVENAQAGINGAEANLANANAKANRMRNLLEKGFVSRQQVDDAEAAVSVQKAALEIARGQLKSALAQREAVQQQRSIVETKGKADIEAAGAKVAQAKASLEYAQANAAQKPAYEQSLAALRSGIAAARAGLDSAKAKRADTVLKSPLDGVVTKRFVDPGAVAAPGQPIISVQFVKQIWVTIAVPEEIIPRVHIGQPARIALDAMPGREFTASVIQINPAADTQSRQFTVRAVLSNREGVFKPGMFARVSLEVERVKSALVVPREAVQEDDRGSYIMKVDAGGRAKRQPVLTGIEDGGAIAIKQGLLPGDKLITMSASPIRDGQTINTGGKGRPKPGQQEKGGR